MPRPEYKAQFHESNSPGSPLLSHSVVWEALGPWISVHPKLAVISAFFPDHTGAHIGNTNKELIAHLSVRHQTGEDFLHSEQDLDWNCGGESITLKEKIKNKGLQTSQRTRPKLESH